MTVRTRFLFLCLVLLVGLAGVQAVAAVPDARLVIAETDVSPPAPSASEPTSVTFTVENSAGSASGVSLDSVSVQSRDGDGDSYGEADSLGSLSPGDDVTLSVPAEFESAGAYDLEIVVEGTDESGETVTVTRPISLNVGTPADDIDVSATRVYMVETDDGVEIGGLEELLAAGGSSESAEPTPALEVRVSNVGAATARDVFIQPTTEDTDYARMPIADVSRNSSETMLFETDRLAGDATVTFTAAYRLSTDDPGDDRRTVETTFEYEPGTESLTLTDIRMEREGNRVTITGNAGNVGLEELEGTVVSLESTDGLRPAAPQRDYFIGTVPDSDFATFDLTGVLEDDGFAVTDNGEPETVPITVSYRVDGVSYEQTVAVPYDVTTSEEAGRPLSVWTVLVAAGFGAVAAISVGAVRWRRGTEQWGVDGGD